MKVSKMDDKKLIVEQVVDLEKRTKAAISNGDIELAQSLLFEYIKLVQSAIICSLSNEEIFHELLLLKSEVNLFPDKSKRDPLVQLKWLDNSVSKLILLVRKLHPETEIEIELHPKVLKVAGKLLQDGYYSEAVFAAFKSLEEYVKSKSGAKNKYGKDLMAHVFSESNPILKIECSHPDTAKEEQEGFRFIFMGAMLGIRGPKAHYEIIQRDRTRTLQYLALASLLFKTVDDATLVQNADVTE